MQVTRFKVNFSHKSEFLTSEFWKSALQFVFRLKTIWSRDCLLGI